MKRAFLGDANDHLKGSLHRVLHEAQALRELVAVSMITDEWKAEHSAAYARLLGLGDDAAGLSASNIARLTNEWETEYRTFQKRSPRRPRLRVRLGRDGVHCNVRLEDDRLCTLVMIGVRPDGTKELIAVEDGYRESAES